MRIGRRILAAFLSILTLGLGQGFNRQWRKATVLISSAIAVSLLATVEGFLHSFWSAVAVLTAQATLLLYAIVDALIYGAGPSLQDQRLQKGSNRPFLAAFILLACFHLYATFGDWYLDRVPVRAYKVYSPSSAPALMEGDRFVADMKAFVDRDPQRGDLVVYDYKPGNRWVKRVIALQGDKIVSFEGKLYLNGEALQEPYLAGVREALGISESEWREPEFEPVIIPVGQYFVAGDNRPNSFDSRYDGHGLVSRDKLRGKPLYIYWSADSSRIGKALQ